MDQSEHILRQLIWIKWLTILLAICFLLIAITIAWGATQMAANLKDISENNNETHSENNSEINSVTAWASVDLMLTQGKEKELLQLSNEREKNFPKDPYVFWNRARAYYQLGEYEPALKTLRHLHDLAPGWPKDLSEPYIKAIEEKLLKKQ